MYRLFVLHIRSEEVNSEGSNIVIVKSTNETPPELFP